MMEKLPLQIERLFWDIDPSKIDLDSQADTIMERVLNYGNLSDWQWLASQYGQEAVRESLSRKSPVGRDNFRPAARRLASCIFKA